MNKTTRVLIIGGAVAVAAVAAYQLIPALKDLAKSLRTLRLMVDTEDPDEDEPESYRVSDPEVLRRIDEAIEKYPEGWVTRERPVRKSVPEDDPAE
jgi:phage-related baseplate assembly protein